MSLTKVSFSMINGAFANVLDYGAVGNGSTNCVTAFEACRDACIANDLTMYIPDGEFYLPGGVDLFGVHKIRGYGVLTTASNTEEIIVGSNAVTAAADDIELFTTNGTIKVAGMENGRVKIHSAYHLYLFANGQPTTAGGKYHAIAYSTFEFIDVTKLTLECQRNGGVLAWMNENSFICGRIEGEINFLGDYNMNNNVFYSPRVEDITATFNIGSCNYFYNCRFEGNPTLNFASRCFNNVFFQNWANFSYVGMYDRPAANWTISDSGTGNGIVQIQDTYTNKQTIFEIGPYTKGYPWEIFESNGTNLTVKTALSVFFDSGLTLLNQLVWFTAYSDSASFNFFVEAYDSSGVKITGADPGIVTNGLTWDAVNNRYASGGAILDGVEIAIAPASGVAFYRFYVQTAGGTVINNTLTYFRINMTQFNNNTKLHRVASVVVDPYSFIGSTAPTYGKFVVNDKSFNSAPAAGQPQGWVCTVAGAPGTWKAMANLA